MGNLHINILLVTVAFLYLDQIHSLSVYENNNARPSVRDQESSQELSHGQYSTESLKKQNIRWKRGTIEPPRCTNAGGKKFCGTVENYPINVIDDYLEKELTKFADYFGDDIITRGANVTDRFAEPGEERFCGSTEKLIYPEAGLTKDNDWKYIVNRGNYKQGIRVEECVNVGEKCFLADSLPNSYKTECRQMYINRKLIALGNDGVIDKDFFPLPSCCMCILKQMAGKR